MLVFFFFSLLELTSRVKNRGLIFEYIHISNETEFIAFLPCLQDLLVQAFSMRNSITVLGSPFEQTENVEY